MSWGSYGGPGDVTPVSDEEVQEAIAHAKRERPRELGELSDLNSTPAEGSFAQEVSVVEVVSPADPQVVTESVPEVYAPTPVAPKPQATTAMARPRAQTNYFAKYGRLVGGGLLLFGILGLVFMRKRE